jgi:hypothetical protein
VWVPVRVCPKRLLTASDWARVAVLRRTPVGRSFDLHGDGVMKQLRPSQVSHRLWIFFLQSRDGSTNSPKICGA